MFDRDERIIVLAQNVRRRAQVIVVDTPFARGCIIEGDDFGGLLNVLKQGHLRTAHEMKRLLQKKHSMSEQNVDDLLEGLFDLHLITSNRRMPLTMEEISMNPSGMPLAPRTSEDMQLLHVKPTNGNGVSLPKDATPLMKLLAKRSSVRNFLNKEITDEQALSLHRAALAGWGMRRSIPSAGGLYPCRVILLLRRDDRYQLHDQRELSVRCVRGMFVPYAPCESAPLYMIIVADYERATKKYGARGWRYAILEAGHMAQNIELHALELGLATCEIGAFKESACIRSLKLSMTEVPLIVVAGGNASKKMVTESKSPAPKLINAYVGSTGIVNSFQSHRRDPARFPEVYSVRAQIAVPMVHRGNGMDVQVVGAEAATRDLAVIKAVAEGVERFSAGWVPAPDRVDTISALGSAAIIRPQELQKYTLEQPIPPRLMRFTRNSKVSWYKLRRWGVGRGVYIPGDFLFYPYGEDDQRLISYATSNGVAAHMKLTTALWGATSELLERESFLAWWFSGAIPPRLSRKYTVHLDRFIGVWRTKGVELRFLDITTSIPSVCAVGIDRGRRSTFVASASGVDFKSVATHACSEVLRGIAGLDEKTRYHIMPTKVRSVEDHLKCFAGGYAFDYVDKWSSGSELSQMVERFPIGVNPEKWFNWVIDNVGPIFYHEYALPKSIFCDQPLIVIRSIIPGVVSIKFGYGEQDLGLPRLRKLMKQCREAGSTVGRTVPKLHPLA